MKKTTIIGAGGTLGSTAAFVLALQQVCSEICLIDTNDKVLENHVMDMNNALPLVNLYMGNEEDIKDSDVIVVTAGAPNRNNVASRNEFLEANLKIIHEIGRKIARLAPTSLIITASNPVDILNYYLFRQFGFSKHQLIGYTYNDSLRMGWAVRTVLSLHREDAVYCPVLGEHGEFQVPIFSRLQVNGDGFSLSMADKLATKTVIEGWFSKFNGLHVNRTTGWTTAVGLNHMMKRALAADESEFIGSAILDGEYGIVGVSVGVPIVVENTQVKSVVEWELEPDEMAALVESSLRVKNILKQVVS